MPRFMVIPVCCDEEATKNAREIVDRLILEGWRLCAACGSYENKLYAIDKNIDHFVILEHDDENFVEVPKQLAPV